MRSLNTALFVALLVLVTVYAYNKFFAKPGETIASLGAERPK